MNISWPDRNGIERPRPSRATEAMTYRKFRQEILAATTKHGQHSWHIYGQEATFQVRRQCIHALRSHMRFRAEDWIRHGTYPAAHIYRALRLAPRFTLELTRRDRWRRALMQWLPQHMRLRLAHRWLSMARTYEGRELIFDTRIPEPFLGGRIDYSRAVDFGIMRWRRFESAATLTAFSHLDIAWIRAARALGLDDPESMVDWIPKPASAETGKLMWLLVRKGVIAEPAEIAWVTRRQRRPAYLEDRQGEESRRADVIDILLLHGIPREQVVATLCTVPDHSLEPNAVLATLALLQAHDITDYGALLHGLADCLFDAAPERWTFVLSALGVRDPAMIVQFRPLLRSRRPYNARLAAALIAAGAGTAQLVCCQELLMAAGAAGVDHDPVAALAVLMAAPCNLSIDQVPDAADYLCKSGQLAAFLAVLAGHGFGASALRFQPFYGKIAPDTLARLIALAMPLTGNDAAGEVISWLSDSGTTDYLSAYEYLARTLPIRTVPQLQQVAKLGFLGIGILRYLVEERRLASKNALTEWFYRRAFGIRSLCYWRTELDPVGKSLFADAFRRHAFNYWESNMLCIASVTSARIDARLGRFPHKGTDEQQQQFRTARDCAYSAERTALLPVLPHLLDTTSGILLAGMVACAWDGVDALDRQLTQLAPLLEGLLDGHGPETATLTEMEADAIALIYRTAPDTVRTMWPDVAGRHQDIADWHVAPRYPMTWRGASWTLRTPLDKTGLDAIGLAVASADAIGARWRQAPDSDLGALLAVNTGQAHALARLAPQLGLLLAMIKDDPGAGVWRASIPALLAINDERGYQHVLNALAFFRVGLADALQVHLEKFCNAQSARSALRLAQQLGDLPDAAPNAQATLCAALQRVAQRVQDQFGGWASGELTKFGSEDADGDAVTLTAVVTKHAAAFFAKEAVKLCTAHNAAMWQEKRHAHLVVFDRLHRSLQGMALLYREVLPALHPSRPVLVIRAINPTDDAMGAYHVSSIVDAFLSTAVSIARASGCVAVAFPPNTGMHLLSNLDPVANDIGDRYIEQRRGTQGHLPHGVKDAWMRPAIPIATSFDAYERGKQTITLLYVVWCNTVPADQPAHLPLQRTGP